MPSRLRWGVPSAWSATKPWTCSRRRYRGAPAELAKLDPRYVDPADGDPEEKLIVLVGVEGRTPSGSSVSPETRGKTAADVVAELLRDADASRA